MNTKTSFKYFSIVLWILSMCSCKKIPDTYPIDATINNSFGFKKGSYWVYRDSISGAFDSAYVNEVTESVDEDNNGRHAVKVISIYDAPYASGTDNVGSLLYILSGKTAAFRCIKSMAPPALVSELAFYLPFNVGTNAGGRINSSLTAITSLSMAGNTFTDVAEVRDQVFNDVIYVLSNIGVVKMKLPRLAANPPVWELQRYKIVR